MIYLIGTGMGNPGELSRVAENAIENAALLIGSKRLISRYENRKTLELTSPAAIIDVLKEKADAEGDICVLLSGDAMFYSAGDGIYRALTAEGIEVRIIPGISSLVYFCAAAGEKWSDTKLLSAHGRDTDLASHIRDSERCFALMDRGSSVKKLCEKLEYFGLEGVTLTVGQRLGYPDGRIIRFEKGKFGDEEKRSEISDEESLTVILAVNEAPRRDALDALEDEDFLRKRDEGRIIPLTKRPVRALSLDMLGLKTDSVLWDVGAGCGSIGIAASLLSPDIKVWALEKDPEALALVRENARRFKASNLEAVDGIAPEDLKMLPDPTHVFIGGSSGNIEEIISVVFKRNPGARIVANIISIKTLSELEKALEAHHEWEAVFSQVSVSTEKRAGEHRLMQGNNPVYIVGICMSAGDPSRSCGG